MDHNSRFKNLEHWLLANAGRPVYWTSMTKMPCISAATAALSDLHGMVSSASDEEIIAFFQSVRTKRKKAHHWDDDDDQARMGYPVATD